MSRPTCIDLFSGCGGLSLGLDRAGFSILAAIDFDEHGIKKFLSDRVSLTRSTQPAPPRATGRRRAAKPKT